MLENTIGYVIEHGFEALEQELMGMTVEELKGTIKQNDLDPCRQYGRVRKAEKLREIILVVTRQRATKGDGFI